MAVGSRKQDRPVAVRLSHRRPVVAIIGRPNVGKSTLFNRLLGARWAITDDQPGVTRDCLYAQVEWAGRRFTLVDTGGYVPGSKDAMEVAVRVQAQQAIEEADLVLLLCEAAGVTGLDMQLADLLRRQNRPCLLVVNKVDEPGQANGTDEFFRLGLGAPLPVSAVSGRRSGDLLTAVTDRLEGFQEPADSSEGEEIGVVFAGRPNVGKSTLMNRLAGEQVSVVHELPGTTRDPTLATIRWRGRTFVLTDTAGLRRRARVEDPVEYYSGLRAFGSIARTDVAVVLIDATEGGTVQDARIMSRVLEEGTGMVVAVNKWDLVEGGQGRWGSFLDELHQRFPFAADYPALSMSALAGKRVYGCLETAARVHDNRRLRVATSRLNRFMEELTARVPPTNSAGEVRLLYATQQGVAPPSFAFFFNRPELVADSYKRFLEKQLREQFGFDGTPMRFYLRRRGEG